MATKTIKEFSNDVVAKIKEIMGDEITNVKCCEVAKNNGIIKNGIIITANNSSISPTIYIDDYYERNYSVEETADNVIKTYNNSKDFILDFNVSDVSDFDKIKNKIIYVLVNKERNANILKDIPSIDKLGDLAFVFRIQINDSTNILIRNDMLDAWNVTKETVFDVAKINTSNLLPAKVMPIVDMLVNMGMPIEAMGSENIPMYVITNSRSLYGASVIYYDSILSNLADTLNESKLIILPSSIHETIVLPASVQNELAPLTELITTVNQTEVSSEDILSDHPYIYDKNINEIIAA